MAIDQRGSKPYQAPTRFPRPDRLQRRAWPGRSRHVRAASSVMPFISARHQRERAMGQWAAPCWSPIPAARSTRHRLPA